jgi:hypothetical protein
MKQADWVWVGGEGVTWLGHVTYMGEKRNAYRIVVGNLNKRIHYLEGLGADMKMIIKCIIGK